jgi:hypothetical protein
MFKIVGVDISSGLYDDKDPVVNKALYSGRKGSLASSYGSQKSVDLNAFL